MPKKNLFEKLSWTAAIVSALIAIVVLGYSLFSPAQKTNSTSVSLSGNGSGNRIGTVAGNVTILSDSQTVKPQPIAKLPLVFKAGIVGSEVGWFESQIGPPVREIRETGLREYKIDDCKVELKVRADQTIEEATLYVSPICSFNWRDLDANYADLPPPDKLRFGDVMKDKGRWTFFASCITYCGNSSAPFAELRMGASHSNNWLVTALGAIEIDAENQASMEALGNKIQQEKGDEFILSSGYECDYDLNGAATGVVENMRVNYVTIRPLDSQEEAFPGENQRCKK